jgi:hypothetical protein
MVYYCVPKQVFKNLIIVGCCIKVLLNPYRIYSQLSVLYIFINEWKKNSWNDAMDLKLFIQQNYVSIHVTTLGQFDE